MKLQNPDIPSATIMGVKDSADFTITASAQAFSILSSSLYSDPIKAIVRELSTNAWDGHKMAGRESEPFEVSLPTPLSPVFILRDFGIGMSHDEVMDLYSSYFGSNKSDNNDVIGALGLGSKSPLGYTNNFTVESIQGGVKNAYMIHLNEEGFPTISHTAILDTTEDDGVCITVPTEDNDTSKWESAAQEVYKWFPASPTFMTSDPRIPERMEYTHEFDGIRTNMDTDSNAHYSYDREWNIIQGLIAYPLNSDHFESEFFNKFGGEIHVELGEVMFSPSRESINYNTQTIEAIQSYITKFDKEFMARKLEEISDMNMTEVLTFARNFRMGYDNISHFPVFCKAVEDSFKKMNEAEGFYMPDGNAKKSQADMLETFYTEVFEYSDTPQYTMTNKHFARSLSALVTAKHSTMTVRSNMAVASGSTNHHGRGFDHAMIICNDTKRGIQGKVKQYLRDTSSNDVAANTLVFVLEGSLNDNADTVASFFDLGYENAVNVSDIIDTSLIKSKRAKLKGTRLTQLQFRENKNGYIANDTVVLQHGIKFDELQAEPSDKTRYWFTIKGTAPTDADRGEMDRLIKAYARSDISLEVYGVKIKDADNMEGLTGWKHFKDYKSSNIFEHITKADLESYARYNKLTNIRYFLKAVNTHKKITDGMIKCKALVAVCKAHKANTYIGETSAAKAHNWAEIFELNKLLKVSTKTLDKHLGVLYNIPTLKLCIDKYNFDLNEVSEIIELINHFAVFNNTGVRK